MTTIPIKEEETEGENEAGVSTKSTANKMAKGDTANCKTYDPKSRLEVRRWRRGCYTLLHDNDREQEYSLDARYDPGLLLSSL